MQYACDYDKWLDKADNETKQKIKDMPEKEKIDAFRCRLEFGTGGLRGIMGVGTNRMNKYTVRQATQGLANEILEKGNENKGVVIAFDSRNNSKTFADECVSVLCANGIKVYIFNSLRPTPELSFAVRYLGCARGIVITASHNPKEYNGYKVYGEDGGQIPPQVADSIIRYINNTDFFDDVKLTDNSNPIIIGKEIDDAYINSIKKESMGVAIPPDFKVVYTPLHGSGNLPVRRILSQIGADVFTVPEQEKPDGDFPTVKSPNPENSEAFDIAVKYAKIQNADLVLGTDPDSDRLGVVARKANGEYVALNGNQTGCLLCEFILRKSFEKGTLPKNGTVIKTIVTTEMIRAIAHDYSVETLDVLTGFKYIGERIKCFESTGNIEKFVFGLEESYGYLKGTYARDKDAVVAAMLICEVAAECKNNGITLYDKLQEIYKKYGYYTEKLQTIVLEENNGEMQRIMKKFRNTKLPIDIIKTVDYSNGIDGLPKSNVLKFYTTKGWLAIRPSGTEPKIKLYYGACGSAENDAKAELDRLYKAANQIIDNSHALC